MQPIRRTISIFQRSKKRFFFVFEIENEANKGTHTIETLALLSNVQWKLCYTYSVCSLCRSPSWIQYMMDRHCENVSIQIVFFSSFFFFCFSVWSCVFVCSVLFSFFSIYSSQISEKTTANANHTMRVFNIYVYSSVFMWIHSVLSLSNGEI